MEVDAGGIGDVYQAEGGLCGLLLGRRGRGWWREICQARERRWRKASQSRSARAEFA
jgi:hypothetical protein